MDIYEFINSKDIRNYLKEINYEFSPIEAAWVVWQCLNRTLKEKHEAWQEIIDTMPDMSIEDYNSRISLHKFLKEIIALEEVMLEAFYRDESNAVYYYFYIQKKVFLTYDDMIEDLKKLNNNHNIKINLYLSKNYPNKNNAEITIELTPYLEVKDISSAFLSEKRDSFFERLWFPIPTPFKQGDIVCFIDDNPFIDDTPYVITFDEKAKSITKREKGISAYRQVPRSNGEIELSFIYEYMNLKYYNGELDGKKRIIKALSNHLKGKIDVGLFANAYHQILTEQYLKDVKVTDWNENSLKLAGLKEK